MSSLITTENSTDICSIKPFYRDDFPSILSTNLTDSVITCQSCSRLITDQFLIKISNFYFHENCAICSTCQVSLTETSNFLKHLKEKSVEIVKQKCYERDGKLFCKTHYYNIQNRCAGCNLKILPDDVVYKLKFGIVYHVKCHVCCNCGRTLSPGEQIVVDETNKTVSCVFHASQNQSLSIKTTINENLNECLIKENNIENPILFPLYSYSYNNYNGPLNYSLFEQDQPQTDKLWLNFSTQSPTTLMALLNDNSVVALSNSNSTVIPTTITSTTVEEKSKTTLTKTINKIENKHNLQLTQFFENNSFRNVLTSKKFDIETTEIDPNTIGLSILNDGNKLNLSHENILFDKDNKFEKKFNFYDLEELKIDDPSFIPTENQYSIINFEPKIKEVKNLLTISSQQYSDFAFHANNSFKNKEESIQQNEIADLDASYSFLEYNKSTNPNENINRLFDDTTEALNQLNNLCSTSIPNELKNIPCQSLETLVRKIDHTKTIRKLNKSNFSACKKPKMNGYSEKLKLMRKTANPVKTIDKTLKSRLKKFEIFCKSSHNVNETLPSTLPTPFLNIKKTIKNDKEYNSCDYVNLPHYPFEMYAYGKMYTDADSKYIKRRGPRTSIRQEQLDMLNEIFGTTSKPSKHARAKLAMETGLSMRVIQVWFQNRRSKERRLKHLCNFLRHYEKNSVETSAERLLNNLSFLDFDTSLSQSEIFETDLPITKNLATIPN